MNKDLAAITEKVLKGTAIEKTDALYLTTILGQDIYELFSCANRIREYFWENFIDLCSIINAKSGACPEDCGFCAQSIRYNTKVEAYPLISLAKIIQRAEVAKRNGARRFCIVTSGKGINDSEELKTIAEGINQIRNLGLLPCATLGMLGEEELSLLKDSGLYRYHHNLETSEAFFPEICSTHTYQEKVKTIKVAKVLGLSVCSGGIFGMGEGWDDRIEMAFALRDLDVDSIPINFLNPIPGTPLQDMGYLDPIEALRIIAIFRFILPNKEIRICGGRNVVIRSLQPLIFLSGANGLLIGDYLTTPGRNQDDDLSMMADLGLRW
jgi:biotin synthase